jgi:stage II sporulation protein AA (anti-sigma F factor antagonist)
VNRLATISVKTHDPAVVVSVTGEIDLSNARQLGPEIIETIGNDAAALVLDLSETRYVDSAGVRLVFEVANRLQRRRQVLCIVAPEGMPVRRILDLTEAGEVARLYTNLPDALAALPDRNPTPRR